MRKLLLASLVAAAIAAPFAAQAESTITTATGAMTASARLDFAVTIPKVLYLQVGTGTPFTTVGTINEITFAVPAGGVGNSTPVAGAGGDLAGGGVTVRVLANSGAVSLTNTTTGPLLTTGTGLPSVPWSDISVTAAALAAPTTGFTAGAIPHPPFNVGATGGPSTTPTALAATAGLVRREGSWTFAYANTATLPAGTYGDTVANNGRVTYTATAP